MSKTKAEQSHLSKVADLGCLICHRSAQIHHLRFGMGMGQRNSHFLTVPLCPDHHTGDLSIHKNRRQFEKLYGSEIDLLVETLVRLEMRHGG